MFFKNELDFTNISLKENRKCPCRSILNRFYAKIE